MRRIVIFLVLGLFVLGLSLTPILFAADRTAVGKSKQTALTKPPCDKSGVATAKQESPKIRWILVGMPLFKLNWPLVTIIVIDSYGSNSGKFHRPAEPPPQFEEELTDDNGWENGGR